MVPIANVYDMFMHCHLDNPMPPTQGLGYVSHVIIRKLGPSGY